MATKNKENLPAVQQGADLAAPMPDYMKEYQGVGAEDINPSMLGKSFLSITQKTSKAFDKGLAALGDFHDSVTFENYGPELDVVVIKNEFQHRKFNDQNQPSGTSDDGEFWSDGTPLTDDEKWNTQYSDFWLLVTNGAEGEDMQFKTPFPLILSASGISFKTAKQWHTQLAKFMAMKEPIFGRMYTIWTEDDKREKGTAKALRYKLKSGFLPAHLAQAANAIREQVKGLKAQMQHQETEVAAEEGLD